MSQTETSVRPPNTGQSPGAEHPRSANVIAYVGCALLVIAGLMTGTVLILARNLPGSVEELSKVPEQHRLLLLLLTSTAAVFTLISLVLNVIGLLLPDRPRTAAVIGTIGAVLLTGLFGILIAGIALT